MLSYWKKTFASLVLTIATIATASATVDIQLGEPGYGGTGCPVGSAAAVLSPDNKELSIIFDEFFVEAGGRKRLARKNCNIIIPVTVPQGYSISIVEADYRGFVSLPRRSYARFSAEYFFAGKRGPKYNKMWRGYTETDYLVENAIGLESLVWAPCGKSVNLRVNASMMVRTSGQDALATVDSADFSSGIIYKLQWKRCGSQQNYDDFNSFPAYY